MREIDTACYLEVSKPTQNVTQWRVTRGTLDSSNRNSLFYTAATPLTANTMTRIAFVDRLGQAFVPEPGTALQEGDVVHVVARESDLDRIAAAFAVRGGEH